MRSTIRVAIIACIVVAVGSMVLPALAHPGHAHLGHAGVRVASLTGAKEVPGPGDPDGAGRATVIVIPRQRTLCFNIWVEDITLPTAAAHIHEGSRAVAGPVVITLAAPNELGVSSGCLHDLQRGLLRDIKEHPRHYYVNVHTSDYPGGAVRGQLHR